jgi:hypothetical protein
LRAKVKVDAGICGFKTSITATTEDSMNVDLKVVSGCETIKELALPQDVTPKITKD